MAAFESTLSCGPVIGLPKRQVLAVRGLRGTRVESRRGALWITQDGDRRDIVLAPGQSHVVERDGPVLVQALETALLSVRLPAAPRRPLWLRLFVAARLVSA